MCTIWTVQNKLQSDQGIIQWLAWECEEFAKELSTRNNMLERNFLLTEKMMEGR